MPETECLEAKSPGFRAPKTGPDCRRLAFGAIGIGIVARVLWVFVLHSPLDFRFADMGGYVERAVRLATGGPSSPYDAYYPPGTHILLAVPLKLFGSGYSGLESAAALWCLLSCITPFLVWRLGTELVEPSAAALGAAFCALWPLNIVYAGLFSSETAALFLLVASLLLLYRLQRRREAGGRGIQLGCAAGALAAATIAVRPQFALNLLIPVALLWRSHRWQRVPIVAAALSFVVLVAGVVAYNSHATGHLTGISENAGTTFFLGHCPVRVLKTNGFELESPVAYALQRGHDIAFPTHHVWDQSFFFSQGLKCIAHDGLGNLVVFARNILDMTATSIPWPFGFQVAAGRIVDIVNVGYSLLLIPIFWGGAKLVGRTTGRWRSGEGQLLLQLLCFIPIAVLFSAEPRYRVAYDTFGLLLLACVLTRWRLAEV